MAKSPRVVAGERPIGYLDSSIADTGTDLRTEYIRMIATRLRQMFFQSSDGQWTLDFYGETIRAMLDDAYANDMGAAAWKYAFNALRHARSTGMHRDIVTKYEQLAEYMKARRKFWGMSF